MASLERLSAVNPAALSAALPPVRVDPERDRKRHHAQQDQEEPQDKLELHEDEPEAPQPELAKPLLLNYDGLDLSA